MRIRVLLFGPLAEAAGADTILLELPDGATVGDVPGSVDGVNGGRSFAFAVNASYAPADRPLEDGDEVALIPPVSGG